MKKHNKRFLGMLLAIMLCLSFIPMSAFATSGNAGTEAIEQPAEPQNGEPSSELPPDPIEDGLPAPATIDAPVASPTSPPAALSPVEPELLKVVDRPLVQVVYHYFDDAQGPSVTDFAEYAVESSHRFYAIGMANGDSITIAANKYPGIVPVSTDALRFRVLNGSEDITAVAAYDAASGLVSLPYGYMGHEITVEWYCPASEITEVPVAVTVCIGENGTFTTTTIDQQLASNANSITVPLSASDGLVVSQNGIDLPASMCSVTDGSLTISASALGGDVVVSAYVPAQNGGFMLFSTAITQVNHTRSADQIYYGYYTSYYTANGNTAFCLDPNASGLSAGTYPVSRFLQRGSDSTLIKCAYYLYGGPGWSAHKNIMFQSPDTMTAYGLCHAAAAYVYLNDDSAFKGISSTTKGQLLNLISYVNALPMPPEGFDVFIYNEGSSSTQSLMGWDFSDSPEPPDPPDPPEPPADGHLEIVKTSGNPAMTDGNSCYSLAGAVFDVYNSSGQKIGSITTDANGRGRLQNIPPEMGYYIVEVQPPQGYAQYASPIGFSILSDQTTTVTVPNLPQNDPVGILLRKQDAETSADAPQGNAALAGAEFTVKYYKGIYADAGQLSGVSPARTWVLRTGVNGTAYLNAAYLVSGDPFYYAGNGDPTLPLGTVTIQETKAPTGYLINSELFLRQITSAGTAESVRTYNAPIVPDKVKRGGVSIEKWDFDLNRKNAPQGDATLEGAVFDIYNRSTNRVVVDGKTYAPGAVVHTMATDATGTATTANDLLPYGQYEIIEQASPAGYLNTGVVNQTFNITDNGVIVSLKTANTVIKNNVIRGGVETEKWDIERAERVLKQGDATLSGAVLEIWNRSANSVVVGGVEYAPNMVVHTMTTDADGWAGTTNDLLPYGTYEIVEKTPPTGYLNTGAVRQTFTIREHGAIVSMKASEDVIQNNIIRGGIRVEKWDNEINEHRPQGGATFEGAVFEIVNRSIDSVLVLDVLCAPGEAVYTFATDATGAALTPSNLLPYGTYEVRETNPPAGYLATGVLSRTFTIRDHGMIVHLNTSDTAIKNDPIRGDLKGVKISDGDAKRLANVPFRMTSATTGESHVIVTDVNGEFNTASIWNPHSQHTNRGETDRDGIWFGELRVLNDDLGALLYDTYIMEELRCENNREYELLTFTVSIYRHNTMVDLGTLTDDYIVVPEIFTTARDQATNTGSAYVSEATTIIDTVYYSGLKAGQEYTLKGTLMDKASGEPLLVEGAPITAETTFRAAAEAGSVPMEFTFNSTSLKGKAVVVFESLEFEGVEIAVHADIEDEGQTVAFTEPEIGTSAAGTDGEKELDVGTKITLIDTVSYENLLPGLPYTLKGILMDKATGEPLLVDGKEVTAETVFKPDAPSGSVEVVFTLDSSGLMGKTVVVFESLELGGVEIATHADINDAGQTISFRAPEIGTSAKAEDGGKTVPIAQSVTIIDTVAYTGLVPNTKYVLKGTLMDKESGQPLMKDGKAVTAETTFTPTSPSGSVEVRFTFDSRAISGRTLVVFESLELDGKEIAVHADIQDTAQAVSVDTPVPDKPDTPTPTPIIPATPTEPTKPVPQTSDDNMAIIWIVLLGTSLIGAVVSCAVYIRKRKGRKSKRRAAVMALVLCVALLAGSGLMLAREVIQYTDSAAAYDKLAEFVQDAAPQGNAGIQEEGNTLDDDGALGAPQGATFASRLPAIDFGTLQRVNPDVKAWLVSEGTAINYPVVQGSDNSQYLKRLYDGTRKKAGCLFIDYENEPFMDRNTIIYGHNMLDGSMFAELAGYREQAYYSAHPDMLLATPDGGYIVEVFAAFSASPNETGVNTSPWRIAWEDDAAYTAWLEATVGRSLIQTDVDVNASDQVLTLSTCTRKGRDRFVVIGRLVPVE